MKISKIGKPVLLLIGMCLISAPVTAEEIPGQESVLAHFAGYDNDDLLLEISNSDAVEVTIKGLSFRGQILYRPVEKNAIVAPATAEQPVKILKFRSNGDFVWSENHMKEFRVAYVRRGEGKRQYAAVHPPRVSDKKNDGK